MSSQVGLKNTSLFLGNKSDPEVKKSNITSATKKKNFIFILSV